MCHTTDDADDDYPDIEDLFPPLPNKEKAMITSQNQTDIIMDLEKLDINKFLKKLDILQTFLSENEELVETRRKTMINQEGGYYMYREGAIMLTHTKTCDTMLTIIYMARHKVRSLENDPNFNTKDTGYRIAYLYRRLKRLHKRMLDLYTSMYFKKIPTYYLDDEAEPLQWHQKCIKIYTDFMYLFWVLMRIDGLYHDMNNKRLAAEKTSKRPKTVSTTTTTSAPPPDNPTTP